MKKLSILILHILILFESFAQDDHKISLAGQRNNAKRVGISIDEVIDARADKSRIGFVQKSIANVIKNANFENGFEQEIKNYFISNSMNGDNSFSITLRVNHFYIYEETGFSSESANVEIDADFLVKDGAGYRFVKNVESKLQAKGIEVTSKHPKIIASALEDILSKISVDEIELALHQNSVIHEDSLLISSLKVKNSNLLRKYQFPILTEDIKEGFYTTFFDFRNNKPINGPNIYLNSKIPSKNSKIKEVIPYYSETNKKIKDDYWGFCLADTIYIQADKKYFPLEFDGTNYTFYAYRGSDPNYYNPSAAAAGVLGGAIGGAIAGASSGADYAKPVKYTIDLFSGEFSGNEFSDISKSMALKAKSKIIVVRYPKGQIDKNIVVTLNDTTSLYLGINEFVELELKGPFSPSSLCVNLFDNECLEFMPQDEDTKYFTVTYENRKGIEWVKLIEIADDIGNDFVNRVKRQAKKSLPD